MTSPRVIELPRRLEPVSHDTFLAGSDAGRIVLATSIAVRNEAAPPMNERPLVRMGQVLLVNS